MHIRSQLCGVCGDQRVPYGTQGRWKCLRCSRLATKASKTKYPERTRLASLRAQQSLKSRYSDATRLAGRRGLAWELTLEQFAELRDLPCQYCQLPLNPTGSGLDRKDSARGYTRDNVVPCCNLCNKTKSNLYSYDEFLKFGSVIRAVRLSRAPTS